jgi:hypothetical protein
LTPQSTPKNKLQEQVTGLTVSKSDLDFYGPIIGTRRVPRSTNFSGATHVSSAVINQGHLHGVVHPTILHLETHFQVRIGCYHMRHEYLVRLVECPCVATDSKIFLKYFLLLHNAAKKIHQSSFYKALTIKLH